MLKYKKHHKITNLLTQEFLGIDKSLQTIQDELVYDTSKLTEICKWKSCEKLKEVEDDLVYSEAQRQLCKDRLEFLNTERERGKTENTIIMFDGENNNHIEWIGHYNSINTYFSSNDHL